VTELSFKSLWRASVATYKAQYRLFLHLSNIIITVNLPWIFYNFLIDRNRETPNVWFQTGTETLLFLASLWTYIAITQAVAKGKDGEPTTLRAALAGPRSVFWRVLGVFGLILLVLLIPFGIAVLLIVVALTAVRFSAGLAASNLLVAWMPFILLIPVVLFMTFLTLAPTVTIIEGGMTKALKRSYRFVRGRFWRIFGCFLWLFLIMQGPQFVVNLLDSLNFIDVSLNQKWLIYVMTWIYSSLVYPLTVIFTTLLYRRLHEEQAGAEANEVETP
jgi:hypothetical protein